MTQDKVKKDLNHSIENDSFIKNNLTEDQRAVLKDYDTSLSIDFYSHSYELYKEVIVTPGQFNGTKGMILKLGELLDKSYSALFEAIGLSSPYPLTTRR